MKSVVAELNNIIDQHLPGLQFIPETEYSFKPSVNRWSKKEILGHLVDSAQNNIRRFIVVQYEERPKIIYKQDDWVTITNYQQYKSLDLISLWYLLNKHICHILDHIPEQIKDREVETENMHTIEWIANDYIRHLLHHLHQVLDWEPVPYP